MNNPTTAAVPFLAGERKPVRIATTANIPLQGLQNVDGVALLVNDRVLVKNQTDKRGNGIYTASAGKWYRTSDARSPLAMDKGTTVAVQEGTIHSGSVWRFANGLNRIGYDEIELSFYHSGAFPADAAAQIATPRNETTTLIDEVDETIIAGAEATRDLAASSDAILSAAEIKFPTVTSLLSDTSMAYVAEPGKIQVSAGDIIEAGGFRYQVAASSASEPWLLTTASGVHLSVLADGGVVRPEQYGATGNAKRGSFGSINSGSNIYTASGAAFTTDDVGKLFVTNRFVANEPPFYSTILSVTNATTLVLANNSPRTYPSARWALGSNDTVAWQQAIASGYSVSATDGKMYFVTAALGAPAPNAVVNFKNSLVLAAFEQSTLTTSPTYGHEALFYLTGVHGVTFKADGRKGGIVYYGQYDFGADYGGLMQGIKVNGCDDFTATNLFIEGFNLCGIVISMTSNVPALIPARSARFRVEGCWGRYCRMTALGFGHTDDGKILNNFFERCGISTSVGTGYGLAGIGAHSPTNTIVQGNHCNDNFRKGIDFHGGTDGVISGNVCKRNVIDGIYTTGVRGFWNIIGNLVGEMANASWHGLSIQGIRCGDIDGDDTSNAATTFNIVGNTIEDFALGSGVAAYPILFYGAGLKYGAANIANNVMHLGKVSSIIRTSNGAGLGLGSWYDMKIDGNVIKCDATVDVPFVALSTINRKKSFSNNQIEIGAVSTSSGLLVYGGTSVVGNSFICVANDVTTPGGLWSDATDFVGNKQTPREILSNNTVNGLPWRDWDGWKYIGRGGGLSPSSGVWTRGSRWQNNQASAGASPGSVCTTAGGAVAGAWISGATYAAGVARSSGANAYEVVVAGPGATTFAPTHTSGTLLKADGYQWAFKSSALAIFKAEAALAS